MSSSQQAPDNRAFILDGHLPDLTDITDSAEIVGFTDPAHIVSVADESYIERTYWPVFISILGNFLLLKNGQAVAVHSVKAEALLISLALQPDYCLPRDTLLNDIWPDNANSFDGAHGANGAGGTDNNEPNVSHSLNNSIHNLKKLLSDALGGATPVLHVEGIYRLNIEAGIGVDLTYFERLADHGDREYHRGKRAGNYALVVGYYTRATNLYKGDPHVPTIPHAIVDVQTRVRCEKIRDRYLTMLTRLAEYYFTQNDYETCIEVSFRLLYSEPLREDVHRMMMRCYVKMGQRSGAMRQYRFCKELLQSEFGLGTRPEAATTELFEQVRLNPESV